jgi:hypothetical protein
VAILLEVITIVTDLLGQLSIWRREIRYKIYFEHFFLIMVIRIYLRSKEKKILILRRCSCVCDLAPVTNTFVGSPSNSV